MIKIYNINEIDEKDILIRTQSKPGVEGIVHDIIEDVRANGDAALRKYAEKFDGAVIDEIEVSPDEIESAMSEVEPEFIEILKQAADNIREFHSHQVRNSFVINKEDGVVLGQKVMPLERVGLYIPGGTASYPSSVLMNCIPAKIAGVRQIVMTTPTGKDGKISPNILAAAKIAGVDKVYKTGGAQAVAALCFGTETIKPVDKIVGPGNVFVAEAKRQVYGFVDIDMIAGPSEILIIAEDENNPAHLAADMLSQAEHDRLASAVLVTDSADLAKAVSDELEKQIPLLPRSEIARESIDKNGKIILTDDLKASIAVANKIAPEHLEVCVDNPFDYLSEIRNAGSVFLGKNCPEALGDYFAGPNHTLPTSGTARFSSPLSVDDFVKKSAFTYYTKEALSKVNRQIAYFAEKEGLSAHARSALIRTENIYE
ncbi:MAG: histidinol dehydrogenase [Clostridia bacterium]|nr:histidinol dehydrogenase [Clostridia bacterium]